MILHEPAKVTAVFALSILLAQWRTDVALWSWLLLIPATVRFKRPRAEGSVFFQLIDGSGW